MAKTETENLNPLVLKLAKQTLVGDVRDAMLDFIIRHKTTLPYKNLPEEQQKEIVARAVEAADKVVEEAVKIIAADGKEAITFSVNGITRDTKGQIVVKLVTPFDPATWQALGAAATAQVVTTNSEPYKGESKPVHAYINPDQPALPGTARGKDDGPVMDKTEAGRRLTADEQARQEREALPAQQAWPTDPKTKLLTDEAMARFAKEVKHRMETQSVDFDAAVKAARTFHKVPTKALNLDFIRAYLEQPLAPDAKPAEDADEAPPSNLPMETQFPTQDQRKAFREGAHAYRQRQKRDTNRYVGEDAKLAEAWDEGWTEARSTDGPHDGEEA